MCCFAFYTSMYSVKRVGLSQNVVVILFFSVCQCTETTPFVLELTAAPLRRLLFLHFYSRPSQTVGHAT